MPSSAEVSFGIQTKSFQSDVGETLAYCIVCWSDFRVRHGDVGKHVILINIWQIQHFFTNSKWIKCLKPFSFKEVSPLNPTGVLPWTLLEA